MQKIKEKITLSLLLQFCSFGFVYAALAFSVVNDGSYAIWRKTILQTLIFSGFFFYMLARQFSRKKIIGDSVMNIPILGLICFVVIVSFFAQSRAVALNAVIQLLSCVCSFYIFMYMAKRRELQTWLVKWTAFITLVLCVYGLLIHFQIYLIPEWQFRNIIQKGMLCATFANHNYLAGWLEMAILLFIGLYIKKKWSIPTNILMTSFFAVMVWTLVLSQSRGGWISTSVGALFILMTMVFNKYFKPQKKILPIIAGISFLVILGVLGSGAVVERGMTIAEKESDVIPARIILWKGTLEMIKTFPLTGVGPGNYSLMLPQFQPPGLNKRFYEAHNDYLQFVAEMGVLFIPLMFWLIISFFKTGFKKLAHPSRQTRWITLGAMGGVVAILVHSASDFNLQVPSNALLFTLLAALVAAPAPAVKK